MIRGPRSREQARKNRRRTGLDRQHPLSSGQACPDPGLGQELTVADPWLSADDIAAHLGVTKDTVYVWIADRRMPAHKLGRLWRFQVSEVDAWVRAGGPDGGGPPSGKPDDEGR
jgi:excisionase family DNA binding protein